ncbi:MAG: thioesterase family protein [Acidobacteria bacterium]|nr:thioesterase family protein [Acidobacteriota bacterium]MCH8128675.1 thioesterase family protein [Acidobacteriota bacterium]
MSFASATAVSHVMGDVYQSAVEPGWDILGATNGGYLMALSARAMAQVAERPHPVTITAHFLNPAGPGSVTIDTNLLKTGKRFATVQARLNDPQHSLVALQGTFGDLQPSSALKRFEAGPPELPPPEECVGVEPADTFPPPIFAKIEVRLHPDDVPLLSDSPRQPRIRGWFRLRNGEPIDTFAVLLAVDGFPPAIFNTDQPPAWTPTVELTAHVRAVPVRDGWLACAFTTRFITGGFLEEDGEVWDATGRLIAQSRQLALVPRRLRK